MDFLYVDKTNKITDDDIVKDLLDVKDEVLKQDKIIMREYFSHGKYGKKAIINHFGSWNKLLSYVNIEKTRSYQHLSKEDIFCLIENLWIQLGRQPNLREFESMTKHTKKLLLQILANGQFVCKNLLNGKQIKIKIKIL